MLRQRVRLLSRQGAIFAVEERDKAPHLRCCFVHGARPYYSGASVVRIVCRLGSPGSCCEIPANEEPKMAVAD
jgi:hypothetical protein